MPAASTVRRRNVETNAQYNAPTNWRDARSTTTVSWCDGSMGRAFVTIPDGFLSLDYRLVWSCFVQACRNVIVL